MRTRPALSDLVLATCFIALAVLTSAVATGKDVAGDDSPTAWWHWLLVVLPAVPVAFRRTSPLAATSVSVLGQILVWGSGLATAFFAPLVMIYTVCADEGPPGRRLGIASGIGLSAMTLIGVSVAPDVTVDLLVFVILASAMAYILGVNAAQRRAAEVELAEQLATARVERDSARDRAAATERQRIAHELHDIVGHSLAVIAVRAEAADRVALKNPRAPVEAVAAIATTARSSLAEVRRVLAGLQQDDTEAELAPLPSLGSIPALLASVSDAGLAVSLTSELPVDEAAGAAIGAGTYRIVQEALTNVLKHGGPGVSASVRISLTNENLLVRIDDDGRGASNTTSSTDGNGLAGMRERAEVLGGELDAGPKAGGGYRVTARLPISEGFHAHQ